MTEKNRTSILFVWQALVAPSYRSFFEHLAKDKRLRIGLIAPKIFRELGSQLIESPPFDSTNNDIAWYSLETTTAHTQIVWYHNLRHTIKDFFDNQTGKKIIVSIAEPYSPTSLAVSWQAKKALGGEPYYFGCYAAQNINKKFSMPIRAVEQANFKNSDFILSIGEEHTEVLRNHGYYKPVIPFPLWYDKNRFKPLPRWQSLGELSTEKIKINSSSKMTLGFVGTISSAKGLFDLIEGLASHHEEFKQSVRLIIGGTGPDLEMLEHQIAALNADGWEAVYLGAIEGEKMPAFYGSVDVLVVPSRTTENWKEQFGRVIVEANAMGVPVIGSNSGEIPNVSSNKSLIFPQGRSDEIAKRIKECLFAYSSPQKWEALKQESIDGSERFSDQQAAGCFANAIEGFRPFIS